MTNLCATPPMLGSLFHDAVFSLVCCKHTLSCTSTSSLMYVQLVLQAAGGPGRGNFKYTQGVRNQQPGAPNMPPQQQPQQPPPVQGQGPGAQQQQTPQAGVLQA